MSDSSELRTPQTPKRAFSRRSSLRTVRWLGLILVVASMSVPILPGYHPGSTSWVPSPGTPVGGIHAAALSSGSAVWLDLTSTAGGPSERNRVAMTYDAADGYVLLFGGYNAANGWVFYNDTWTFSNGSWTELFPTMAPSVRANAGILYDPAIHAVVLFGGNAYGSQYNDTWTFAKGHWTQLHPSAAPSARFNPGFAYDAAGGTAVLFGGDYAPALNVDVGLRDTWTFNGTAWANVTSTTGPGPRVYSAMAFDPIDRYVVLFGGVSSNLTTHTNDTWAYANGSWSLISATSAPPARSSSALAEVSGSGDLLFGGNDGINSSLSDTWIYQGAGWSRVATNHSPSPRCCEGLAFDAADDYAMLFGGRLDSHGAWVGDTWVLRLASMIGTNNSTQEHSLSVNVAATVLSPSTRETQVSVSLFGGIAPYALSIANGQGQYDNLSIRSDAAVATWVTSYSNDGVFAVRATVTDGRGHWASAQRSVSLGTGTLLTVSASESTLPAGSANTITFRATISGGTSPYTIQWAFGDRSVGSSVSGMPVAHTFTSAGTFVPRLSVTDHMGVRANSSLAPVRIAAPGPSSSPSSSPALFGIPAPSLAILAFGALTTIATVIVAVELRRRTRARRATLFLVQALERNAAAPLDGTARPPEEGSRGHG